MSVIGYFLVKKLRHPTIIEKIVEKSDDRINFAEDVRDGVKEAIRDISYEEEQMKLVQKKNRSQEGVYSTTMVDDTPIKSGGELIPFNLSDKDKDLLRMFYNS